MRTKLAHRAADGQAHNRFSQTAHDRTQCAPDPCLVLVINHLPGQHKGPCRGIDQAGGRLAQMRAPVVWGDLVLDQLVNGFRVGHTQQGLGQAHQGDALLGRQPVFAQELLHQAGIGMIPDLTDQIGGPRRNGRARRHVHRRGRDEALHRRGLIFQIGLTQVGAEGIRHGPRSFMRGSRRYYSMRPGQIL